MFRLFILCGALALVAGCPTNSDRTFEGAALPVLEARCLSSACHGVTPAQQWPEEEGLFIAVDDEGHATDIGAAHETAVERIVTTAPATLSSLIRVPMAAEHGGGPHFGGHGFSGPDDPGVQSMMRWIESEALGGEDVELTALEEQFAETVMPTMIERCGQSSCHGPGDGAFGAFAPHIDLLTGVAAPLGIRQAYKSARKHLDLWSDNPIRSRLIRKGLRVTKGGLPHRRARFGVYPLDGVEPEDAPAVRTILSWVNAEREAIGVSLTPAPSALLFVAGPPALRTPFRIESGPVGSELYITPWPVVSGAETDLTSGLHPEGPAEIRDPAISHKGDEVTFAMRRDGDSEFRLWRMELSSGNAELVVDAATPGSFVQPAYAPDSSLIAVWDGHNELAADGEGVAPELVRIDMAGELQRLTFTPTPEVNPSFLASGKTRGQLLFSTRRTGESGPEGVMFRFPLSHNSAYNNDSEYHAHFGSSMAPTTPLAARDLPDGRQVFVGLSSAQAGDDRGMLGVLDRSLGPVVSDDEMRRPSLLDYTPAIRWLAEDPRFRDPQPLPDGRLLVSADSQNEPGVDALYTFAFDDIPGSEPLLDELLTRSGSSLRSPIAVVARPSEVDPQPSAVNADAERGYLVFRDVGVLESLYGRTGPSGERLVREDIVGIRLLTPVTASADEVQPYSDGGTTTGLGAQLPARVVGEWPLPDDRSAWFDVPARTPLLVQLLDSQGMAVGRALDRWYFTEGLETVSGGTNVETYSGACAGCHGSSSGDPDAEIGPPADAVSSASITLSSHEQRNPRVPRLPTVVSSDSEAIDYRNTVGPLFEAGCATSGCHTGNAPAGGLDLDATSPGTRFPLAYEALMETFVEGRARRSALVERLLGVELDATRPVSGLCPPDGADDDLIAAVIRWVDSGAAYDLAAREGGNVNAP